MSKDEVSKDVLLLHTFCQNIRLALENEQDTNLKADYNTLLSQLFDAVESLNSRANNWFWILVDRNLKERIERRWNDAEVLWKHYERESTNARALVASFNQEILSKSELQQQMDKYERQPEYPGALRFSEILTNVRQSLESRRSESSTGTVQTGHASVNTFGLNV